MGRCLQNVDITSIPTAMNDSSPFTLLALVLAFARHKRISREHVSGTSKQSDYLPHFIANHMFYRISLEGSRRIPIGHIDFRQRKVPNWNPLSIVGQHMQQAGATLAEAIAYTLSSAIQCAQDFIDPGLDPETLLQRFTFFFDTSISFFEEIAKLRGGRPLIVP